MGKRDSDPGTMIADMDDNDRIRDDRRDGAMVARRVIQLGHWVPGHTA